MEIVPISEYWELILKSKAAPFIGIIARVPMRLWRDMAHMQAELKEVDSRQLYAKPSTFHITIKGLGFLGEKFDDAKLETVLHRVSSILEEFHPFTLEFRGLGVFPTSVHIKVVDPADQLRMMNKRLVQELGAQVESSEYDEDAYIPHVTIATFTTKEAGKVIQKVSSPEMQSLLLGECMVFEVEAIEANMFLALGPEETQDRAFSYLRSFHLGEKPKARFK